MRTLLLFLLIAPAIALAQASQPLPTDGPSGVPIGQRRANRTGRPPSQAQATSEDLPRQVPPAPAQSAPQAGRPAGQGDATITPGDQRCVPLQGRFVLSFNKADVVDILEQASRWTCRNFIYTDDVARGKITLLSKTAVNAEEAYAAFLAALTANNITVFPTGKYYKLARSPDSKKLPIPTYTDSETGVPANEQYITKVIKLQATDADQLRGVLGNFLSPQGADLQSIPPDTLIITDTGLNIRRIERMLETIDRPGGGDLIRVVQLRYAAAKDVADKLNQIFQAQGAGRTRRSFATPGIVRPTPGVPTTPAPASGQPAVPVNPGAAAAGVEVSVSKVLADDRTNKLIVIADEKSFQRVQDLVEQLDVPTNADGGIHVVFLKNASAEDLATTLGSLSQNGKKTPTGGAVAPLPAGAAAPARAPGTGEAASAELFSGEVKVTADKAQNALLVQANGADFAAMSRLIEKLDRARRQVFVEAVVMEVNLTHETDLGVGMHGFVDVKVNGKTGVLPLISDPGTISSLSPSSIVSLGGFLTGFEGPTSGTLSSLTGGAINLPSIGVLIRALQSNSDVNVISTPHVLATDNEESEISVGQNVPFQTSFISSGVQSLLSSSTSSSSAASSLLGSSGLSSLSTGIQRENVELKLKMKPQISEGGNVRLTVEVSNEEIASTDPTLGPTTSKRSVKTQIVAKDESTIVIGGLIQERATRSVKKVPLLGSLPVLGALFRDSQSVKQKTNLLVFLTPYIIRDQADYRRIYEKKRKEQEDFQIQFYGKKTGYQANLDLGRRPGPLTRLHQGVLEETSRFENGGAGLPGERMSTPPQDSQVPPPASPQGRESPTPKALPPPAETVPAPQPDGN